MFDRPVIYALNDADKELDFRIEPADEHTLLEKLSTEEIGVAKWVQKNNKHAGATTNTLPNAKCLYLAVRGRAAPWRWRVLPSRRAGSLTPLRKT